ncbi:MAG: hypothetical protein MUC88_17490 [Planctomycetes bacterium]|nr:hypothetical protein [Planctomycetota bacterium]
MLGNRGLRAGAAVAACAGMLVVLAAVRGSRQGGPDAGANLAAASQTAGVADAPIDPVEVRRKIAALAVADETLGPEERPAHWLGQRRERIMPQLIAALDDPSPTVAEQVMQVLFFAPMTKELVDVLAAKAADPKSPRRYSALRKLEQAADDPRAAKLLDAASTDPAAFPDARVRARWAFLAGQQARAVSILEPLLTKPDGPPWEISNAISLLGEIGHAAAVPLLEPIAAGYEWQPAAAAYQALAKIDPQQHGLTAAQTQFLEKIGRSFKETIEQWRQRVTAAAALPRAEIRPYVIQMVRDARSGAASEALLILAAWRDTEALPAIRAVLTRERAQDRCQAVAAYLTIDASPPAGQDVLDLLRRNEDFLNDPVLQGIAIAEIPVERKASLLRAAAEKLGSPDAAPRAARYAARQGQDFIPLLVTLMDRETDLHALGWYCESAAWKKDGQLAAPVRRALTRLAAEPVAMTGGSADDRLATAAVAILEAAAVYDLKEQAPAVRKLLESSDSTIRAAAESTAARMGLPGAIQRLYAQLGSGRGGIRQRAAEALTRIPTADEAERAARERAVLKRLGTDAEDEALRVLATCGRTATVAALRPILDGPDVPRAVYAAWVLAQLPDEAAAQTGLRRVAIFATFHHQIYQQGAGIDFPIAPHLSFHQVTQRLNPDPADYSYGEGPVRIPEELLEPFPLDKNEQAFAVAGYRWSRRPQWSSTHVLPLFNRQWGTAPLLADAPALDAGYVPLFKVMATEDVGVKRLMVAGQAVAYFPYRQRAAQALAAITGRRATYLGLAGEKIDSAAAPRAYQNQDKLLAGFVVDQIVKAAPPDDPQSEAQWQQVSALQSLIPHLRNEFGEQIVPAIRAEAARRKANLAKILPDGA